MENKYYDYWLCSVPGVGNRTIDKLQNMFGTAAQIYRASEEQWTQVLTASQVEAMIQQKAGWNLQEEYDKMIAQGIRFLLKEEAEYPMRLRQIPDAPYGIFVKGHLPMEDKLSVAIIGARDCSEYGRYVAMELGKYLGENDVQVISGMARGIDGISQEAALKAGGVSFAVLGSGVDVCYPTGNRVLYEQLQKEGGILSIYPPGTLPRPQNFPPRNRIVSGLADIVVVIEARQRSGTLITVDMALEQGKEVYVVPGRITDRLSDGCNRLLKQGAGLILSPEEFLAEIRELWQQQQETTIRGTAREVNVEIAGTPQAVTGREIERREFLGGISVLQELQPVYDLLDFYPQSLEQLLEKLSGHYTISTLNIALMQLCLQNHAIQVSPGHFCRSRKEESKKN